MRLLRRLAMPVSENQTAIVLVALMVVTSVLLLGIVWQSNIITYQRDVIRQMWDWKTGG